MLSHDAGVGHTAGSMVVRRITLLHDVVYTVAGKPASHVELSIPIFVHYYLIVMRVRRRLSGPKWPPFGGYEGRFGTLWLGESQSLSWSVSLSTD